jgi:hypothetical protein
LNENGKESEDAGESLKGLSDDWSAGWVEGVADERVWRANGAERTRRRDRSVLQAVNEASTVGLGDEREREKEREREGERERERERQRQKKAY